MSTLNVRLYWVVCTLLCASFSTGHALTIRVIDWVQGRPEIPHPAVNGKKTMLQAIIEASDCGTSSGDVQFRWDWNADGDFLDANEGWKDGGRNAGPDYYFHTAMIDVQLPSYLGDTVLYPKIQARCRNVAADDYASSVMPVLVRVDRICTDYPSKLDGGCGPDDNLLLTKQTINDRAVDRAMWWMMARMRHYRTDDHSNNVHTCVFWAEQGTAHQPKISGSVVGENVDSYFVHGHALNVFIRRSHGAGPFRATDPLYEHVVQCGVEQNVSGWSHNSGSYRWSGGRLNYNARWMSYASTTLGEPIAGYGKGDYVVQAGESNIKGKKITDVAQGIANGLMDCAGTHHGGVYWHYSCGQSGSEDLSTSGWAPEALRMLSRKLGTDVERIKGSHMTWVKKSASYGNNTGAYNASGGCSTKNHCRGFGTSYHMSDSSHNGYRAKLAGNALVSLGYANNEVFNPNIYTGSDSNSEDVTWQLREHWVALSRLHVTGTYNGTGEPWGYYYIYAATKGLRSFVPEVRYLASFQSSYDRPTSCTQGDHDACDLVTTGLGVEGNLDAVCNNDDDCKSGNYCRSDSRGGKRCKAVMEEGLCLAAHHKSGSGDNNVSSGTGRSERWQCSRDWALEFAQFLLPYQDEQGTFQLYTQYGYGRVHQSLRTALSAQIIQTWLETWAIARAIPQATTPGIPVTFNHGWSHILDPGTHIKQYQWDINSLDGLWWEESNCNVPKDSQQTCTDDGSHAIRFEYDEENPNLGAVLKNEKIVGFITRDVGKKGDYASLTSDELMDMINTEFIYTYTNSISWEEVAKIKVTLRTIDTEDRPVIDDKSVTVKLSYENHKPVIVAHPLGSNAIYSGYLGLPMLLDAKTASYDVDQCVRDKFGNPLFGNCQDREVFPGNDEKPAGFADHITKICFDLDRDGTFCETGAAAAQGDEIQMDLAQNIDRPGVSFTPQRGQVKIGELTGIPVMVCDDGQWNGKCWDSTNLDAPAEFRQADCSLCGYGSASVKAVENLEPPQVPNWQPDPRKAEVTLVLDEKPQDEEHFELSDYTGRTTRFVFDDDSNLSDGTRKIPMGKITVSGRPQDGETFVISDYANPVGVYFVFLDDSEIADGSDGPKTIIGIPHVRVGFMGAWSPEAVAERIAAAINSKSINYPGYDPNNPRAAILPLNVRADVNGREITLTMLNNGAGRTGMGPDHSTTFPEKGGPDPNPTYYQYVNMGLVTNVDGTDFAGGMIVGMQGTDGNVESIMERLTNAIQASELEFGKVTQVGRAIELEQGAIGFDGNTQVSTKNVTGLRTQERGEEYCGNYGQVCCDGITAPKCGDGTGCLAGRCVGYGGTYAQDSADACAVPNSLMAGEPEAGDGCVCPSGLTATKVGEFDQAAPANAGGAAEQYIKVFACTPGGPVTYDAPAQGELPAASGLPYTDFQGGFGKTFTSNDNRYTCLQGPGLVKTVKPLPAAQCPETGFDLNGDGTIDRMGSFSLLGVRHSDPEEQCIVQVDFCMDTLSGSKPDTYTYGGFYTTGGLGGGINNPLTGQKSCPTDFQTANIPMLLRHPNAGDAMDAQPGTLHICQRKPPKRWVDLPGDYEYPERVGGKSTFFAGHDGAFEDPILGGLNAGHGGTNGYPVWRVQPGNVLELDFSSIVDPEGVLGNEIASNGVRMIYEILPPDGLTLPAGVDPELQPHVLRPSIGFEHRVSAALPADGHHGNDNYGLKPLLEPSGDGVQYFKIRVTAYDAENKSTNRTFVVKLDNRAPRIRSFQVQPFPLPPTLPYEIEGATGYLKTIRNWCDRQNPPVPNCVEPYSHLPDPITRQADTFVRHAYRSDIYAFPNAGVGLLVSFIAEEDYDEPLVATARFITDEGSTDGGRIEGKTGVFRSVYDSLPPYEADADGNVLERAKKLVTVQLDVTDGEMTVTEQKSISIAQPPPALLEELEYNFDLYSDGEWEITDSEQPIAFPFFMGPNSVEIPLNVKVLNNDMLTTYAWRPKLPNTPPEVSARLVSIEGREVSIVASAGDKDWDRMTYRINWGDGTAVSEGTGTSYTHLYPVGLWGDFVITVTADDGRPEGQSSTTLSVSITPPGSNGPNVESLSFTPISEETGVYDGVGDFAIDSTGSVFAHNYLSEIRRYTAAEIDLASTGRQEGVVVSGGIECCGDIVAPSPGELYIAAPNGLYYVPGANGANFAPVPLSMESYVDVEVSPNWGRVGQGEEPFILAASGAGKLERYDETTALADDGSQTPFSDSIVEDIAVCKGTQNLTAVSVRLNREANTHLLYVNTSPDVRPDSWQLVAGKASKLTHWSLSIGADCLIYIGSLHGYLIYDHAQGLTEPESTTFDSRLFHTEGVDLYSAYVGSGPLTRIVAWEGSSPVLAGTNGGVVGANEPWNAATKPYWTRMTAGFDYPNVSEMELDSNSGHLVVSVAANITRPKYCRKRDRRRRNRYTYYFCGVSYNYSGGLFRTDSPLLSSKKVGPGASPFDFSLSSGVELSDTGGIQVSQDAAEDVPLWQVNTLDSTVSRWDTTTTPPQEVARYRVGLPSGECVGNTSPFTNGCNVPSRVAVDNVGDVYVASVGYGMQGTVTKIAGDRSRCVDRDNDGQTNTTSIDGTALPYTMPNDPNVIGDECVLWTANVGGPGQLLRSISIGLGDSEHPDGYPWVGSYGDRKLYRLNPKTGTALNVHNLDIEPFGSVLLGDKLYISTLGNASIQVVDIKGAGTVSPLTAPPADLIADCSIDNSYGIGADSEGRVWLSGWDCPYALGYIPGENAWCRVNIPGGRKVGRGISGDGNGRVWAALGGDGQSYLAHWSAASCAAGSQTTLGRGNIVPGPWGALGPTGVNPDADGKLWLSHYLSPVLMSVDTKDGNATQAWQTSPVYSFADSTGVIRRKSIGEGSFQHDFQKPCENGLRWGLFSWEADVPEGAELRFSVKGASTIEKLTEATAIPFTLGAVSPQPMQSILDSGNPGGIEILHDYIRVRADMRLAPDGSSPVLKSISVAWECL